MSDKTKISDFDIMNLTNKFRKVTFDFLLTNPNYKTVDVKDLEQSDYKTTNDESIHSPFIK